MAQQLVYTGPDRNTRPARFKPPKNACDVHAHIYGPVGKFPYPDGVAAPPDGPYEDYMKMHEVLGIDRGVLTQSSKYKTDNRALLDAVERAWPALRGIVAAELEDINDKLINDLEPKGIRGIRIHKHEYKDIEEISRRIHHAGWRVELVPTSIEEMVALRPVFERMKCGILIDQMALPDASKGVDHPLFQSIVSMVRDGLIWIKLSHAYHVTRQGPPYADVLPFAQALVKANKDRCLWGTDWPHPQKKWATPNDGTLLDLLADWVPDEAVRNQILVDNPAKLNRF